MYYEIYDKDGDAEVTCICTDCGEEWVEVIPWDEVEDYRGEYGEIDKAAFEAEYLDEWIEHWCPEAAVVGGLK